MKIFGKKADHLENFKRKKYYPKERQTAPNSSQYFINKALKKQSARQSPQKNLYFKFTCCPLYSHIFRFVQQKIPPLSDKTTYCSILQFIKNATDNVNKKKTAKMAAFLAFFQDFKAIN